MQDQVSSAECAFTQMDSCDQLDDLHPYQDLRYTHTAIRATIEQIYFPDLLPIDCAKSDQEGESQTAVESWGKVSSMV